MISIAQELSPDGKHYASIYASMACIDVCNKIHIVLSGNCIECIKRKYIMLSGRKMMFTTIRWLDDNEIEFSYVDGMIDNAIGYKTILSYTSNLESVVFLKIKITNKY